MMPKMKKIFLCVIATLSLNASFAQSNTYIGKDSLRTYQPLINGTPILFDDTINIGFNFKLFDTIATKFVVNEDGMWFIHNTIDAGMMLFLGNNYYYLQDTNTRVSYSVSGTSPNRSLKVEMKNLQIEHDGNPLTSHLSYQIDLQENGTINMHVGSKDFDTLPSSYTVLPAFIEQLKYDSVWFFMDSITNPSFTKLSLDSINNIDVNNFPKLDSIPNEGRWYSWVNTFPSIVVTGVANIVTNNFLVYPNPSNGMFNIQPLNAEILEYEVFNTLGQQILKQQQNNFIDISSFPKGIYILNIKNQYEKSQIVKLMYQ